MLEKAIFTRIKSKISSLEFARYIAQIQYDEDASKSDTAVFLAPNQIIASYVKTKYAELLAQVFEDETGIKTGIKVLTKKSEKITKNVIEKTITSENQKLQKSTILNPSFNFDSFVVGSSNQFAYNISRAVCEKPAFLYNPFFIYGPTGLGKTHLLQSIGNEFLKEGKGVIYSTIENFMNDFTYHLRNKTMDRFREKYRSCDVLLIDDIQFLSNKEETQKEFFHTFNELHNAKKQIVLTSDKHPKKIAGLEERLKSRFEWGSIADIGIPELETKIAIIKMKCELDGVYLNEDVINYIATNMGDNIREIEGAIINLNAYASLMKQNITLEFAKNVLKEHIKEKQENITLDNIIKIISKELNIKPSEIKSKKRSKNIVNARRIVIYLARNLTTNTMPALADFFGLKDHTSVSHAMKTIHGIIEEDEGFRLKIDELKNKVLSYNGE